MISLSIGIGLTSAFGRGGGGPFELPASTVSAHSVSRKLFGAFTGDLIRVRRSSDNLEADIGFDGDDVLDETALLAHVGAGDGFIVKVYEQSGDANAVDYQQTTASLQPKIVDTGAVIKRGGKPFADQTPGGMDFNDAWTIRPTAASAMAVWEASIAQTFVAYLSAPDSGATPYYFIMQDGSTSTTISNGVTTFPVLYKNGSFVAQQGDGTIRDDLHTAFAVDAPLILRSQGMNFTETALFDSLATAFRDGGGPGPAYWAEEVIVDSPAAGDIAAIEADQASFYGITLA